MVKISKTHTYSAQGGGQRGKTIPPNSQKWEKILILCHLCLFKYPRNTFKTKINKYFIKINPKTAGGFPVYGQPGGAKHQIWFITL